MIPKGLARILARIEEIERSFPRSGNQPASSSPSSFQSVSFDELIEEYAEKYGMDAKLVRKLVQVESGFNPSAVSPRGAMGLMQLMPETCKDLGVQDPFDVRENLDGGVRYLKGLLERFGDLQLALAAYNAGPGRVKEYGGVPPFLETQRFIKKVLEG